MSAFAVFGRGMEQCRRIAERTVPVFEKRDDEDYYYTSAEWNALVEDATKSLFSIDAKSQQISPAFDAPQFCHDWIVTAGDSIKNPTVYQRTHVNKDRPTDKPKYKWEPYK